MAARSGGTPPVPVSVTLAGDFSVAAGKGCGITGAAVEGVEPGNARLFAMRTVPVGETSSMTVPAGRLDPDAGAPPSFGSTNALMAALWPVLRWSSRQTL